MITFSWNKIFLYIFIFLLPGTLLLFAQNDNDEIYALKLYLEEDYFRSITEWKKIDFYTKDISKKIQAQKYISYCYLYSNKNKTSLRYLFRLLDLEQNMEEKDFLYFLIGLNYYSLQISILTQTYWDPLLETTYDWSYLPLLFKTTLAVKSNQLDFAVNYLNQSSLNTDATKNIKEYGFKVLKEIDDAFYYNPFIISLLSAIIPGSGQAITGHMIDALQAFSFVGLFGLTTYGLYLYDSTISKNYIATGVGIGITAVFYISNIIGAYKTAEYKNKYIRDNIILNWEKYIWEETKLYLK